MPVKMELASTGPHESVRTDYLTVTFRFQDEDQEQDLLAYFHDLAEKVLPAGGFRPTRAGRHYALVYQHDSGVTVETSPPSSVRSTHGSMSVTLSGAVWGALDAWERSCLIRDIRQWPGYYHCTRWDPQITVLDPPITVAQVVEEVEAGRLWATGFSQQNPWGHRKADGSFTSPPTQYFGSPSSSIRLRVYDHGAAHSWGIPSLRVEVQIRKRYATDHFNRLAARCIAERETPPLLVTAEETSVKDALVQHADFRDTSRWEGRQRPTKWRQTAPKSPWWDEMLQHRGDPAALSHKPKVTLDRARVACINQYGRKLAMNFLFEIVCGKENGAHAQKMFFLDCCGQLRPEDLLELLALVPEESKDAMRRLFHHAVDQAEDWGEFEVEKS